MKIEGEIVKSSLEINLETLSDFDFDGLIKDFEQTILKIHSQDSKEIEKKFKGLFIAFGIVSFFTM